MSAEHVNRIQNRHTPEVLSNDALLESQRILLELAAEARYLKPLSKMQTQALATLLGDEVTETAGDIEDQQKRERTQRQLWSSAHSLVGPRLHENSYTSFVEYVAQPGYKQTQTPRLAFSGQRVYEGEGIFTPNGIVFDPLDGLRQGVIQLNFNIQRSRSHGTELQRSHYRLYTDNLSATPPAWEFKMHTSATDIMPAAVHNLNPHFMHDVPETFVNDERALTVIEKLGRIIARGQR